MAGLEEDSLNVASLRRMAPAKVNIIMHFGEHCKTVRDPFRIFLIKKRLLQKSGGNFSEQSPGEFCGGFFGGFFSGLSPWKKIGGKIHQKIHGKIQIGIWEFRGQNPHCKDPALILETSPLHCLYESRDEVRGVLQSALPKLPTGLYLFQQLIR